MHRLYADIESKRRAYSSAEQPSAAAQRLIPRYAELRPLDVPAVEPERKGKRLIERDKVTQAFDNFFASCEGLVESDTGRAELIAARQRFIQSVG